MNSEAPLPNSPLANDRHPLNDIRRLFYTHVGAVVLTFVIYAIAVVRSDKEQTVSQRIECLSVFLGLSFAQAIFVLPVLVCQYVPDLRL